MEPDKMFSCQSFLLHPEKTVRDLRHIPPGTFININDTEAVSKIEKHIGAAEIEGAIVLSYYDQQILTLRNWDYVDFLWNDLVRSVDEVLQTGEARCRFWGCPCEISLCTCGNSFIKLHANWNDKRYFLPEKELFMTILYGAAEFFKRLNALPHHFGGYAGEITRSYDIMGRMNQIADLTAYPWDSIDRR